MVDLATEDDVPSYAGAFVRAFRDFLSKHPAVGARLAEAPAFDADERVPIALAHGLLAAAIELTQDPDLGLKVGRTVSPGDAGVADYAIRSAGTVHEALVVAARYIRLVNDAIALEIHMRGSQVALQWETEVVLPRAAEDFLMAATYSSHMRTLLSGAEGLECWFTHPEPSDIKEYAETFGPLRFRFAAPCAAYVFDKSHLEERIEDADPKLHQVLRRHAEALLGELPASRSLTDRLRHHLLSDLSEGRPTAEKSARRLRMSTRTLERRLEREGTTFGVVLDDVRRRLALQYLTERNLNLSEIAFLVGFSQVGAFHRAFKRWTGTTPLEYRRAARSVPPSGASKEQNRGAVKT